MSESEYKRSVLINNLIEYREAHKMGYSAIKSLEKLIEQSDNLPLSSIYTIISHLEREKAMVLDQINTNIQEMLPKQQPTDAKNQPNQTEGKPAPENTEQSTDKSEKDNSDTQKPEGKAPEENKEKDESNKKHNFDIDDNIDDSDEDFDLED